MLPKNNTTPMRHSNTDFSQLFFCVLLLLLLKELKPRKTFTALSLSVFLEKLRAEFVSSQCYIFLFNYPKK